MRILIADDEPRLLAAYKVCLEEQAADPEIDELGSELFRDSDEPARTAVAPLRVDYVSQGAEAITAVQDAMLRGDSYSVIFLDMRMPPGIDGLATARQIRQFDENVNIVIVTGYSDHTPHQIASAVPPLDKLYYLAKPFDTAEIQQFARSLCAKWSMEDDLRKAQIDLRASEAHCRHMALHDQLTRLPNRQGFRDYLSKAISECNEVTVILVDLDHFKRVNDTLGHHAGDELICRLSELMVEALPGNALLARLGGDEFGVVLCDRSHTEVLAFARQLVSLCGQEMHILGTKVFVGASIGIAQRQPGATESSELLRRADLALYAVKSAGRGGFKAFEPEMDDSSRLRAQIDARLRQALDVSGDSGLKLVYQPIVCPASADTVGYEALLRWSDSQLGDVSPAVFVPIAEETGLVLKLGEWVISKAIADSATWPEGMVSINLSTRHFQSSSLVAFIVQEATKHGMPLSRIQLEITETALFDDPARASQTIREMRKLGLRIALDDFGTGYSSLVNLRDFEIDSIKIDKSFVASLGSDRHASAIVQSVSGLARSLGLSVVAEGVENDAQLRSLRDLGCEMMQGYYFSRPVSMDQLPYVIDQTRCEATKFPVVRPLRRRSSGGN